MDEIDRKLIMILVAEPRIHFQELSRRLGISKQAVYRRFQSLIETGVIERMTADVSVPYLDAVPVVVFGRSRAASVLGIFDRLSECELTRRIIAAGGNYIYVNGQLRDLSELDYFSELVKQVAELEDPKVGIYSPIPGLMPHYTVDGITERRPGYRELSLLDLRIIASLKDDVRKPEKEIAEALGVTAKTVKRHLDDMISNGSLDLHVRTDSPLQGDMLFLVHVTIREGVDKGAVGRRLLSRYPFQDAFLVAYSNIPNLLVWIFWTDDISEMRKILKAVDEDEDIVALMPNPAYLMRIYSTWRDRLPQHWMNAPKTASKKRRRLPVAKR